jgi:hypothetical protein
MNKEYTEKLCGKHIQPLEHKSKGYIEEIKDDRPEKCHKFVNSIGFKIK